MPKYEVQYNLRGAKRVFGLLILLWWLRSDVSANVSLHHLSNTDSLTANTIEGEVDYGPLANLLLLDILPDDQRISNQTGREALLREVLASSQGWFEDMADGEVVANTDIPSSFKQELIGMLLGQNLDHGQMMSSLIGTLLEELGYYGSAGATDDSLALDRGHLRNLYQINSVSVRKVVDHTRGESGLEITVEMNRDQFEHYLNTSDAEIINMSFQYGAQKVWLPIQRRQELRLYEHTVWDDTGEVRSWYLIPSAAPINFNLDFQLIDGESVPIYNGNPLTMVTNDDVQTLQSQQPWENIDEQDVVLSHYEAYNDSSNRYELNLLAQSYPDRVFVTAAGNINSFAPLVPQSNVIVVGELYAHSILPYTQDIIFGNADIYLDATDINAEDLQWLFGNERIDSSSESTAIVSALLAAFRFQHPHIPTSRLSQAFIEAYGEVVIKDVHCGLNGYSTREYDVQRRELVILNVARVVRDLQVAEITAEE